MVPAHNHGNPQDEPLAAVAALRRASDRRPQWLRTEPERRKPCNPAWGHRCGHERFEPTGVDNLYQGVDARYWPVWGKSYDLAIGNTGAPGGSLAGCNQGGTYHGTSQEICGGSNNWGATDVEVWYPR